MHRQRARRSCPGLPTGSGRRCRCRCARHAAARPAAPGESLEDIILKNVTKVIDNKDNLIKTGEDIKAGKLTTGGFSGSGAVFGLANALVQKYRYNNIMDELNTMDGKVDELLTDMSAIQSQLASIETQDRRDWRSGSSMMRSWASRCGTPRGGSRSTTAIPLSRGNRTTGPAGSWPVAMSVRAPARRRSPTRARRRSNSSTSPSRRPIRRRRRPTTSISGGAIPFWAASKIPLYIERQDRRQPRPGAPRRNGLRRGDQRERIAGLHGIHVLEVGVRDRRHRLRSLLAGLSAVRGLFPAS